jgi:hypothetical protein
MPRMASTGGFPRLYRPESGEGTFVSGTGVATPSTATEQATLLRLQRHALEYFLDNQEPSGLVLDRQRNHGPRARRGLCSMAATGMGCIALALASAPPHLLISPSDARRRIRAILQHALDRLPHDHGVLPHFVDSISHAVVGRDAHSTIDSAWLYAGALWAAEFLQDAEVADLARRLFDRVDWKHWSAANMGGLLHHGKDSRGRFLPCAWDRLNGETVFMYVLAAGAEPERALSPVVRQAWQLFPGSVAGHHFHSADLGLFVFQYGLDLLDLFAWRLPDFVDLHAEARVATWANRDCCRRLADRFVTYRRFWGLSAGDGPGDDHTGEDAYRCYAPNDPCDGTAHLTATLASVAHDPAGVFANIMEAEQDPALGALGRYGLSNVNLDRGWVARDMVGIDAGAAALALDNYLMDNRVRRVFHRLDCVARGLAQLGFVAAPAAAEARQAS